MKKKAPQYLWYPQVEEDGIKRSFLEQHRQENTSDLHQLIDDVLKKVKREE